MPTSSSSISPRLEVTLRIALVTLITSILSVAYLPSAIPPNLSQLIGIFGPTFALSLPHAIFILGAAIPSVIVVIVIGLLGGTALLAAATVSNGLYVAIFAVWALFCTSLSYGPNAAKTASYSNLLIVSAGLLSLGSWQLVQNGLEVTVAFPTRDDNLTDANHFLSEAIFALEEQMCGMDGCADELARYGPPGVDVMIPGTSIFSGQTAIISCQDLVCAITIPGGLWLVSGFWKWQGLTNPMAVFRNFLIVLCWALLCISVGVILPPFRTVRKLYTRGLLPSAISDATEFIEINEAEADAAEEEISCNNEGPNTTRDNESEERDMELRQQKLIHDAVLNANGGKAPLVAYEPRICRAPLEGTWPKLKEVAKGVNSLLLYALASDLHKHFRARESKEDEVEFAEDIKALKACSLALAKDDPTCLPVQDGDTEDKPADIEEAKERTFFVRTMNRMQRELVESTTEWLNAMHNPKFVGFKDAATTYMLWILPPIGFLKALFTNLLLPFRPKKWNLRSSLLALKFALGVVILVICEVYWVQYRGFAVGETEGEVPKPNGPVAVTLDEAPNVYSGWNLLGYVLATTPTMEGTVKKGFFRALGTAVGGFSAWIAIIVCSGSFDQSAPVNLYALVAWLTITTGIVGYFSLPRGPAAFLGLKPNSGLYGMYYALTQSLCALEIAAGVGTRDVIVSNRIVATATGVLMAMIVAVLPPHNRGSNPEPMKQLLQSIKDTFSDGLRVLVDKDKKGDVAKDELDNLRNRLIDSGQKEKAKIEFLLKDASKLNGAPVLKVDPSLTEELERMTLTAVSVVVWLEFGAHVARDETIKLSKEEMASFYQETSKILHKMHDINPIKDGEIEGEQKETGIELIQSEREEPDLLLDVARFIYSKLAKHELFFAEIKNRS